MSLPSEPDSPVPGTGSLEPALSRRLLAGWWLGLAVSAAVAGYGEWGRAADAARAGVWLFDLNIDTTLPAVLLLLLPVAWLIRQPVLAAPPQWLFRVRRWLSAGAGADGDRAPCSALCLAMFVFALSWLACQRVSQFEVLADSGLKFGDLPPALHDEFSYRFQSRTFAAGVWSQPSHPTTARMFDQMHVLNEGQFASRYFPGTGLWLALFETPASLTSNRSFATGAWVATGLLCACLALAGRELAGNGIGLLSGTLCAVSPGLNLFGNLLLAHAPTLAGLGLFLLAFLRLQRELQAPAPRVLVVLRRALPAGVGLAFAMLCRPMTAAGCGLPFGLWLLVWLCRNRFTHVRRRPATTSSVIAGFALPLACAAGLLLYHNAAITGDWRSSPYQLYTDLFTPRHRFGFDNVVRGEKLLTPRVLDHYDRWAVNLDASLAMQNVGLRLLASSQWTLGIVALLMTGSLLAGAAAASVRTTSVTMGLATVDSVTTASAGLDSRWWLIAAAVLSLHVAHVPYWYDGILHWHYVFETGPLLCLLAAAATQVVLRISRGTGRPWLPVWWAALLLASVLVNQVAFPPFWGLSRVEAGTREFAFSRLKQHGFRLLCAQTAKSGPSLVLVRHDPADRHIDYVDNPPSLTGPVLTGRLPAEPGEPEEDTVACARRAFPDRSIWVFDAQTTRLLRVR